MPIPILAVVTGAGKVAKIIAKTGTALFRFVRANPRLTLGTTSITALAGAIGMYARTEQEKTQLIREISEQNPSLGRELAQLLFPRTDIFSIILLIIIITIIIKLMKE